VSDSSSLRLNVAKVLDVIRFADRAHPVPALTIGESSCQPFSYRSRPENQVIRELGLTLLVANLYGTSTGDNQRTENLINNFYLGAYGRFATSTELWQQSARLNNKAAEGLWPVQSEAETMGRELLAAQVTDYSISDGQYVKNLYESFLQRGPDSGGLGFWTSIAAGGPSHRQDVLNAFATCGPFRDLAGALYREVYWLVPDHLGTTRMVATRIGSLASVKRHDYLPFGEELGLIAGRTTTQGYAQVDNIRQRFTDKERDSETDLDWFGPGRYYSNRQGRFTSIDPGGAGARATNPQSLNRYAYTLNRPTVAIDPNGLSTIVITVTPQ